MNARAAHQVEQERLGVVVFVVSHADDLKIALGDEARKPRIAQSACRHLNAFAVGFGLGLRVEVTDVQRNGQPACQFFTESLVAVALVAAQVKVAVGRLYAVAQFVQDQQQCHRVGPAT